MATGEPGVASRSRPRRGARWLPRWLDEALFVRELRRLPRWGLRAPLAFALTVEIVILFFLSGWIDWYFGTASEWGDATVTQPLLARWLSVAAGMALLHALLFGGQFWVGEIRRQTLGIWLVTHPDPARASVTAAVVSGGVGLAAAIVPLALLVGGVMATPPSAGGAAVGIVLVIALAMAAGSWGSASGFLGARLPARPVALLAGVTAFVLTALLWCRINTVRGWLVPGWEDYISRAITAGSLVTGLPVLYGLLAPQWWDRFAQDQLGIGVPALALAPVALGWLATLTGLGIWATAESLCCLIREPELGATERETPPAEEIEPSVYWRGFRNPVWTREIRTRLRSKETAEFIVFASLVVAAGGVLPLALAAQQLQDALALAELARSIFFWLSVSLVTLVLLIAPGLAADSIALERERGTLPMLICTRLSTRAILTGKVLGVASVMLLLVSPSLPLFAVCTIFHGAEPLQVAWVYLSVLWTIVVTAGLGVAAGAIWWRPLTAKIAAYGFAGAFGVFPCGPLWLIAAFAFPEESTRRGLAGVFGLGALIALAGGFLFWLLWITARERLRHSG